jgi:hypothetical protein
MQDWGVTHFHMTDFENRRKQFANWPVSKRIPRLSRLMTIITRHAVASAGMAIDRIAYGRLFNAEASKAVHGPYGLAVKGCLASLKSFHRGTKLTEPLHVVFAFGADGAKVVEQDSLAAIAMNDDDRKYLSVRFEENTRIPALQAADIVAYDFAKEVARILGHHQRPERKLVERLKERFRYWAYMDEEELTKVPCEEPRTARRSTGGVETSSQQLPPESESCLIRAEAQVQAHDY